MPEAQPEVKPPYSVPDPYLCTRSYKPRAGEWFPVAEKFVWRCCKCGHAADMEIMVMLKGKPR